MGGCVRLESPRPYVGFPSSPGIILASTSCASMSNPSLDANRKVVKKRDAPDLQYCGVDQAHIPHNANCCVCELFMASQYRSHCLRVGAGERLGYRRAIQSQTLCPGAGWTNGLTHSKRDDELDEFFRVGCHRHPRRRRAERGPSKETNESGLGPRPLIVRESALAT